MPSRLTRIVAVALLTVFPMVSNARQEDKPALKKEVNAKFGFSFEHRTLQQLATQPDVTLLDAYVDAEPGSFLEVEWLRPRDHSEYIKGLKAGMTALDLDVDQETEAKLAGRKFTHATFKPTPKGGDTKAAFWIEKAGAKDWFFGVTVMASGKEFSKDFEALSKAALSFSLDMEKAPSKPDNSCWVDRTFGFHISLLGFKSAPKPWAEAILAAWSLHDDTKHYGSFFIKLIRPDAGEKLEEFLTRVRKVQAKNERKIAKDEAVERDGRNGARMRIEFEQSGKNHLHDQLFLWDNGLVWQIVAAWRPDEANGKEVDLILAVDKFTPSTPEKAK